MFLSSSDNKYGLMRSISCDKSNNIGCNGQSLKVPFIRFEFQGPAAFVSDRAILQRWERKEAAVSRRSRSIRGEMVPMEIKHACRLSRRSSGCYTGGRWEGEISCSGCKKPELWRVWHAFCFQVHSFSREREKKGLKVTRNLKCLSSRKFGLCNICFPRIWVLPEGKKITEEKGQKTEYYWHHPFLYGGHVSMKKCSPFCGAEEFHCDYRPGKM